MTKQLSIFDLKQKNRQRKFFFYLYDYTTCEQHEFRSVFARQRFIKEKDIKKGKCWAIEKETGKIFMTHEFVMR